MTVFALFFACTSTFFRNQIKQPFSLESGCFFTFPRKRSKIEKSVEIAE